MHQHGATAARAPGRPTLTQGARPNDKQSFARLDEPVDHGIGRSRGGLTTKTHALVDGRGLPLVIAVTSGQATTPPALPLLLAELRVPRQAQDGLELDPTPFEVTRPTRPEHTARN